MDFVNKPKNRKKIEIWIITSTEDIASMNIRNYLLNTFPFKTSQDSTDEWKEWDGNPTYILEFEKNSKFGPLFEFSSYITVRIALTDKMMVFLDEDLNNEDIENFIGADFIIFASRHRSESEIPALLTHITGNWTSETKFGGSSNQIALGSALLVGIAFKNLIIQKEKEKIEWAVDLEVNHHGPTKIKKPLIFMELGSSKANWSNKIGIKAVGEAILGTIFDFLSHIFMKLNLLDFIKEEFETSRKLYNLINQRLKNSEYIIGIGFGGPHYARNFSKIYLNNDKVYISHIVPKYFIKTLTEHHIEQMINNTVEPISYCIIDWKGVNSEERNHILNLISNKKIEYKKTKELY